MTAPNTSDSVLSRHFDDLDAELSATRRLLARFPSDHADWRPHAKSATLAELASHVASLPRFAEIMLGGDEHDLVATPHRKAVVRTADELLALHEASAASMHAALAAASPDQLDARWTLRMGEHTLLADRRGKLLRQHLVSHVAHHRGQLTVYYRLLGVPVPGMYGPSADDRALTLPNGA